MGYDSIRLIYFSPTRTTQKILQGIAQALPLCEIEEIDLTQPQAAETSGPLTVETLTLLGAPVYAGRLPEEAVRRFRRITANGAPAVVVVVYGNRDYEDALRELKDLAVEQGFRPVAAGAFIGEHSYSTETLPIAPGRPDQSDLERARAFGESVQEKMNRQGQGEPMAALQVPGNFPYKERMERPPEAPATREDLCILCGTCAAVCPTGAVVVGEAVTTQPERCLICQACVKHCPTGARVMEVERVKKVADWLHTHCSLRKEPEIFL